MNASIRVTDMSTPEAQRYEACLTVGPRQYLGHGRCAEEAEMYARRKMELVERAAFRANLIEPGRHE